MDVHRPKPVHGWRALASEIGVIVIGVLIALSAEQAVEALHWRHKLETSERAMRLELGRNLSTVAQYGVLKACDGAYLDRLEADLAKGDAADLQRLYDQGSPLFTNSITMTAWDAALASQVGDRMEGERFLAYAESFRRSSLMQDAQFIIRDLEAEALAGRFGLKPGGPPPTQALAAVEKIRRQLEMTQSINGILQDEGRKLGLQPSIPSRLEMFEAKARDCAKALAPA